MLYAYLIRLLSDHCDLDGYMCTVYRDSNSDVQNNENKNKKIHLVRYYDGKGKTISLGKLTFCILSLSNT